MILVCPNCRFSFKNPKHGGRCALMLRSFRKPTTKTSTYQNGVWCLLNGDSLIGYQIYINHHLDSTTWQAKCQVDKHSKAKMLFSTILPVRLTFPSTPQKISTVCICVGKIYIYRVIDGHSHIMIIFFKGLRILH